MYQLLLQTLSSNGIYMLEEHPLGTEVQGEAIFVGLFEW